MAVQRYVLTSAVTVPAGTAAALAPGEPGTGPQAGHGSAATTGGPLYPVSRRGRCSPSTRSARCTPRSRRLAAPSGRSWMARTVTAGPGSATSAAPR
jgi:hypothetical protein